MLCLSGFELFSRWAPLSRCRRRRRLQNSFLSKLPDPRFKIAQVRLEKIWQDKLRIHSSCTGPLGDKFQCGAISSAFCGQYFFPSTFRSSDRY